MHLRNLTWGNNERSLGISELWRLERDLDGNLSATHAPAGGGLGILLHVEVGVVCFASIVHLGLAVVDESGL